MRRSLTVALAALALLVPSAASAHTADPQRPLPTDGTPIDLAKDRRLGWMHAYVTRHVPLPESCLDFGYETGPLPSYAGAEAYVCSQHFSRGRVRLPADWRGMTPEALCETVAHELGHQQGLGHSTDPTDIMYGHPLIEKTDDHGRKYMTWDTDWKPVAAETRYWPCDKIHSAHEQVADIDADLTDAYISRRFAKLNRERKAKISRLSGRISRLKQVRQRLVDAYVGPDWETTSFDFGQVREQWRST